MMVLLLILFSMIPVTEPVSCGSELQFKVMQGLVPEAGWSTVPGLPFSSEKIFTDIAFHQSSSLSFRVLSTGVTAGVRPSIGSRITGNEYACFINVSGLGAELWDFGSGPGTGVSYAGAEVQIRDLRNEDPAFFGEYISGPVAITAGEEAFTAGFTAAPLKVLHIGPAWCQDREVGRFWVLSSFSSGPFTFSSGGAVVDSTFRRRFTADLDLNFLSMTAGMDEDEPVLLIETNLNRCSLSMCPSTPGFHLLLTPLPGLLASLSHREGGEFAGEFQFCSHGLVAGVTAGRDPGNRWNLGVIAGLSIIGN